MELKRTVAVENVAYVGELVKVVVDSLDRHHCLLVAIDGQSLVFYALRCHLYLGQLAQTGEHGVVGSNGLAQRGHHLELWVEAREERCHEV